MVNGESFARVLYSILIKDDSPGSYNSSSRANRTDLDKKKKFYLFGKIKHFQYIYIYIPGIF